jgi:hypothetical protein
MVQPLNRQHLDDIEQVRLRLCSWNPSGHSRALAPVAARACAHGL